MNADDIGRHVRERNMTPFQTMVVGICIFINLLDGFDVLAMAFTAPAIAKEWGLQPTELGILFSAGLAGMATGSVLLSPLADRYGRRVSILICLALMTVGMLLSAAVQSTTQLLILRFVTGLGIGGILPSINTLIAEYAVSAVTRPLVLWVDGQPEAVAVQHQGMSSSRRLLGQPPTSRVSRSAR
ncbi:Vanillate transporter (plasmid) [Roseomonas mucosa]|uniref:MFS transporter n=1 Tax=Roseomonas mucosa TaxID=207340 RepID=UPI00220045DC|nr:MFS transporter [Roseomonas mucosa]QDJ11741.1 Vanillate transporter [Roseomonas mucosa]